MRKYLLISILSLLSVTSVFSKGEEYQRNGFCLRPEVAFLVNEFCDELFFASDVCFNASYYFEKPFSVGVGLGYKIYSDGDEHASALPLYACARWTPLKRKITPFVDLRVGYLFGLKKITDEYYSYFKTSASRWGYEETIENEILHGIYVSPRIGVTFRKVDVFVSGNLTGAELTKDFYNSNTQRNTNENQWYKDLGLQIGVSYNFFLKK